MCERDQLAFWTKLLNLDGFQVVHEEPAADGEPRRFTVIPKVAVGLCPHCGQPREDIHRRTESDRIHDLPMGERAVQLKVRVYQYWCEACARAFTPLVPFLAPDSHATERFLERARQLIAFGDIANAAAFLKVSENSLGRWYYDYLERRQQSPVGPSPAPIRQLGIDELSLKKSTGSSSPS